MEQHGRGWVKGQPTLFRAGHAGRKTVHQLTEVNATARTAQCSRCGTVTIKSRGPAGRNGQPKWKCTGQLTVQHRLSRINEVDQTAFCRGCGKVVPITRKAQRAQGASGQGWTCNVKRKDDAIELA